MPTADRAERSAGDLAVVRVTTPEHLRAAWQVRTEVFVVEQLVPIEEEVDAADTAATTTHLLLVPVSDEVRPADAVATGRVLWDAAHPGVVHIGRVAVRAPWRGTGTGARLMTELERVALEQHAVDGALRVELSAQESALGFYGRLGYAIGDDRYLDANIWHRDAWKVLHAI